MSSQRKEIAGRIEEAIGPGFPLRVEAIPGDRDRMQAHLTLSDARKLLDGQHIEELSRLREDVGVTRNLLLDMVENEASLVGIKEKTPADERTRRVNARTRRRRELFGEALAILQKTKTEPIRIPHPAQ